MEISSIFFFLIHYYERRGRSINPVASHRLLALWLPCVTHGASMLHSLFFLPSSLILPGLNSSSSFTPCPAHLYFTT